MVRIKSNVVVDSRNVERIEERNMVNKDKMLFEVHSSVVRQFKDNYKNKTEEVRDSLVYSNVKQYDHFTKWGWTLEWMLDLGIDFEQALEDFHYDGLLLRNDENENYITFQSHRGKDSNSIILKNDKVRMEIDNNKIIEFIVRK